MIAGLGDGNVSHDFRKIAHGLAVAVVIPLGYQPAAMAAPAPSRPAIQAPATIPDLEQRCLRLILDTMAQLQAKQATIWPGFDLSEIPFVVHRPGTVAYLFNGGSQLPDGFAPLPELPGVAVNRHPTGYGAHFSLGTPIGDRNGASFPFEFQTLTKGATVTTLVHEMFHRFQVDHGFSWGNTDFRQMESPSDMVWAEIEHHLLADALSADDATATRRAREFLAVRRFRQRSLSPESSANESALETIEGTAFYVENLTEWQAAAPRPTAPLAKDLAGIYRSRQSRLPHLQAMLRDDLDEDSYSRRRYYLTGIAQCLLLDRLSPGWKGHVQRDHRTVPEMLATAVGLTDSATEPLLQGVSQRYDLPSRLAKAPERFKPAETPEQALTRFNHSPGRRIALQLPRRFRMGFTMARQTVVAPQTLLLGHDSAITSNDRTDAVHVVAEILLAFRGNDGTEATFYLPIGPDSLLVDGKPLSTTPGVVRGAVALTAGKTKVTVDAASVTVAADGSWTIAVE